MLICECNRCHHQWVAEKDKVPQTCAKCRSPYWNKERIRPVKQNTLKIHQTSNTPEWYTPDNILNLVYDLFGIVDLDPCCNSKESPNVHARMYYDIHDDGLVNPWHGKVFVNPPYGRVIKDWVKKSVDEHITNGAEIILLVPARVDTKWFKLVSDYPWCSVEGRLKFKDANGLNTNPAPFPSAIVYLGSDSVGFKKIFGGLGKIYQIQNQ